MCVPQTQKKSANLARQIGTQTNIMESNATSKELAITPAPQHKLSGVLNQLDEPYCVTNSTHVHVSFILTKENVFE
jgi:hypothetical protein